MPAAVVWAPLAGAPAFQRLLSSRPKARTDHFLLHHLPAELSTGEAPPADPLVDESLVDAPRRLGLVVPKRLARRAVTRNLIRRQARAVVVLAEGLPAGDCLLRLRAGFDVKSYPSAASQALRVAVRGELLQLLASWGRAQRDAPTARAIAP